MADWLETTLERAASLITGRQPYHLEVIGPANGVALSVVSFEAVERMGAPYRIRIELTHPDDLARADYLGRDGIFTIDAADGTAPRKFCGCITEFSHTRTTADFRAYRIVVEAHVARLRLTHASRIYQHQSAPQVIEAILRRHGFEGHQFQLKLRRAYPEHAFRMQYQQPDWDYIHLLMRQEGIYCYFEQGKHGDVLVFADDVDGYIYVPQRIVPYRETAGLEAGIEAVHALQTHTQTVPESFLVADYNPDAAWERFKADANIARKDTTTYGQPSYVYGTHHLDQDGAKWEAQLRHEAAIAWQVVYAGQSNVLELRPARILRMDKDLPDAPNGQVVIEVHHSGARDKAYSNTYKAIPSDRRFRLELKEAEWPKISGTLSARVTSPSQYKYAYLTQQGHYTVRFDLDFDDWPGGSESVPLRLAKPFAGGLQTGFHFPLLDGTEVAVAFHDGNPNRPFILSAHHTSIQTDLITNQDRWLSRNVIRTQSDNKLQMEDWAGEEHVKLSTEHSGKSQLTLGHMVNGRREKRGEGFELRTSGWGAIRSGRGLLVSSNDRAKAKGMQLDMQEAMAQLQAAHTMMADLARAAAAAKAEAADARAMGDALQNQIKDLQQAVMVLSANASVAVTTPESIQHSAGRNLTLTANENADVGVLRKFTVAAGEAISLFAQKMGMKLFASQGKVEIRAQDDAMSLAAAKQLQLASADEDVLVVARKKIVLASGGAALKIEDGTFEFIGPGAFKIKAGAFVFQGPGNVDPGLPMLPKDRPKSTTSPNNYSLSH